MQSKEYDKLMERMPAKWAPEGTVNTDVPKQELIEQITANQVQIPDEKLAEIKAFITLLKGLKVKPREIYRRVKTRFNISVA